MCNRRHLITGLLGFFVIAAMGCGQSRKAEQQQQAELALRGKQMFEQHGCNKCHYVGDEQVSAEGPDLTRPLLANDSSFVRAHLTFVEQSKMPPITLSDEEIRLVGRYIAGLHAAKQPPVPPGDADAECAVCYAPVSKKTAAANKLVGKVRGQSYYFECDECRDAFMRAPEAYIELARRHDEGAKSDFSSK